MKCEELLEILEGYYLELRQLGHAHSALFKRMKHRYIVCNDGAIYSIVSKYGLRRKPLRIKYSLHRAGYHQVILRVDKKAHYLKAHRIVAEVFLGLDPNSEMVVNHVDFNKGNNHVSNLVVCTRKANQQHAIKHNRHNMKDSEALAMLEALPG